MTTNLSGSLSEFSLAEVLSLLGMGGRTALMQVTSADAVGAVHLVEGRISSATADSARAGLLRGVVAALPVPADDLARALLAEAPVRSLVDGGVVDREATQRVASEHCTEAVGVMLDWTSGEFAVWVGSQDPADIGVRLDVQELVAAARERAQEWHELRAALPESDSVLALVPDVEQAPVVDREDWAVLARVDGRRTLAEVLAAQGASPLVAGNRLVQLMGRGLVAVQLGGGDAEQARANQMLDSFDAGGGPVDEVVEELAAAVPEYVPEVHDLFVTEPEAVEEWQVAVADSWSDSELAPVISFGVESAVESAPVPAEESAPASKWAALVAPEFPAGPVPVLSRAFPAELEPTAYELEPTAYELEPTAYELEPTAYELEPTAYELEPTAYELEPAAYELEPAAYELEPTAYELEPAAYELEPAAYELEPTGVPAESGTAEADGLPYHVESDVQEGAPVTCDLEPLAGPVGEPFAWSPWAQEMGLGEAPGVAVTAPESFTGSRFSDMVEDAGGHGHTEAFPVPQAPVAEVAEVHTPLDHAPVGEVAQLMPQPRDPGDGVGEPISYARGIGAHASAPEYPQAQAVAGGPAEGTEAQVESASDPLAGGLLAHLMSSVRGL